MLTQEKSITNIGEFVGAKIMVIAYGTTYLGVLKKVDPDRGFIEMRVRQDKVILSIEHIQSFVMAE